MPKSKNTDPPVLAAMKAFNALGSEWTFRQIVEVHMLRGYVISTPDYFILARPVDRGAPVDRILNPLICSDSPNAWFIFLAAGEMEKAWQYYPIPLIWVGWQRGDRAITWKLTSKLRRKYVGK